MLDLSFAVLNAEPVPYAASPLLTLKLRIDNADPHLEIRGIMLQAQIQIEATRRGYGRGEQEKLLDLFGEPERWGQTLRTMLWTHASVNAPPFSGSTTIGLPVPCTFDFNVAATKYFHALEGGEVPLLVQFSGTVFYNDADGHLRIARISWEKEARYRLPVAVWKQVIDLYYPNAAWLTLRRDVFDRLLEYKMRRGLATFEEALDGLLAEATEGAVA